MGVEVLLEEGEMQPGEDLIGKVQEGLSADVVLVLLSPASVPPKWVLERWKSVFWDQAAEVGTALATLLCADSGFPGLLRRKNFFDLRADRLPAFRAIKRWLLQLSPLAREAPFVPPRQPDFTGREAELESLCSLLADAPGIAVVANAAPSSGKTALALEFARRHRDDFDAVFWLTCAARSAAALAGDLAVQLGVKLDRDLETNLNELRRICAHYRCLLVLDDAAPPLAASLAPRGRTSVLVTTRHEDLAVALSATPFPLTAHAARNPATWADLVGTLDASRRRLLEAMCACAASGFCLDLAARTAGFELPQAREAAAALLSESFIAILDELGPRFFVPAAVRAAVRSLGDPGAWASCHAAAVASLFDGQAGAFEDLTPHWPDLQAALAWSLERVDDGQSWELACQLGRRGVAWARGRERIAEAFEILEDWSRAAGKRSDRRVLEDCAWEQVWILEHWDRWDEARLIDRTRRRDYADQMAFEFA